jgi:hypothetical protein
MESFSYLMWRILKTIKPEQECWETECWSGQICSDGSLIRDKNKGWGFLLLFVKKNRGKGRRNGGEGDIGSLARL